MGSTTSTTTVKNDNSPWPPIQQPIKDVNLVAANLAASGVGATPFPGARVAPMSLPTQGALLGAATEAVTGTNVAKPLIGAISERAASGGMSPFMTQAANYFTQLADEATKPGQANPYFDAALRGQLSQAADSINSYFSAKGRYGSGAHNQVLARQLGNIRASTLFNQFNQDRQRALAAGQQLAALGDAGINNLLGMAQVAPTLNNQRYSDFDRLLKVGQNIQNYQQAIMNDAAQRYREQETAPWRTIDLWNSAMNPATIKFGSGSSSQTSSKPWSPVSLLGVPMMGAAFK